MPYTFTLPAGGTYDLTIRFRVDVTGDVTFAAGTLNVGLQVSSLGFTQLQWSETATLTGENIAAGSPVKQLLQAPVGTELQIATTATIDGPWVLDLNGACTTVSATTATASGHDGLAANVVESTGSTGRLCAYNAAAGGGIQLRVSRSGSLQTSTFLAALSPEGGAGDSYFFEMELFGVPPAPVLDGGVLSLHELAAGLPLTRWSTFLFATDETTRSSLSQAFFAGQATDSGTGATVTATR
jgi:hypothetical protein